MNGKTNTTTFSSELPWNEIIGGLFLLPGWLASLFTHFQMHWFILSCTGLVVALAFQTLPFALVSLAMAFFSGSLLYPYYRSQRSISITGSETGGAPCDVPKNKSTRPGSYQPDTNYDANESRTNCCFKILHLNVLGGIL